jgi:hypothetical protein
MNLRPGTGRPKEVGETNTGVVAHIIPRTAPMNLAFQVMGPFCDLMTRMIRERDVDMMVPGCGTSCHWNNEVPGGIVQ